MRAPVFVCEGCEGICLWWSRACGFESRRRGSKKARYRIGNELFSSSGAPNGMSACGWRRPLSLRRFAPCVLRWKTLRVSSAPHPVGFESRHMVVKKPATARVTGFSFQMVPPAGFEPAISTLKGWRPWPLDDGDSGKKYSRLFLQFVYRWQTGKPPHRTFDYQLHPPHRSGGIYPDHQTSRSVTSGRVNWLFLLQIETEGVGLAE